MNARNPGAGDTTTSQVDRSFAEWVAQLEDRLRAGEDIDPDIEAAPHPEWAERLRRLLPAMQALDRRRARPGPPTTAGDGPPFAAGEDAVLLGDFRVVREIGRGGMGIVYEASQLSLNRRVALKVLPPVQAEDPRRIKRFEVEAQAAACLNHPHIVPVHAVGSDQGVPFFAMQLIEGRTLAQRVAEETAEQARLSPRAVAELGRQAAEALQYAHEQGVIHRDIKPSNLMVNDEGWLWVADFGLARLPGSNTTTTGQLLGTPRYMGPEQALGEHTVVDHRVDIYSLGATLYELLARRPAFDGNNGIDLLRRIAVEEPMRLRRIDPAIPRDLETVVAKAMAKDPADRYATAAEMADDLDAWLHSRPIAARRVGPAGRAWLWCKRRPAVAALAAAAVLAAVVGAAGVIAVQARANRLLEKKNLDLQAANVQLTRQRARAEDREDRAIDAVKKFRDTVFYEPTFQNTPSLGDLRKRLLSEPLAFFRALRELLQADRDTRPASLARLADANFALGRLNDEIGDKENAIASYRESLAIRRKLAEAQPNAADIQKGQADSYNNLGVLLRATGKPDEALKAHESALAIRRKLVEAQPDAAESQKDLASSYHNLGNLLGATGKPGEALKSHESALAILRRLNQAQPDVADSQKELANSYNSIGNLLHATGKAGEALKAYGEASRLLKALVAANPSVATYQRDLASIDNNLGILLRAAGKPAEALTAYESALAIRRKLVEAHPIVTEFQRDLAGSYHNLGLLLKATGKPGEALTAYESAAAILRKLIDANPSVVELQRDLARIHNNSGNILVASGKPAEAGKAFDASSTILRKLADAHSESPDLAAEFGASLGNRAALALQAKRFEEARSLLLEAITWQKKALARNPGNPAYRRYLADHLTNLINAARGLGDADAASAAERELATLRAKAGKP